LVATRKKQLAEALGRHQFAIGTAAGTELLAHTARALSEANPASVFLALDAKNAFCTVSRAECLQELENLAPELLPCAELFSCRESQYYFWDSCGHCHRLRATSGVDQGDPLAPLLFACGVRPRLRALEDQLRNLAVAAGISPEGVSVLAYLDDVVVVVPPELASQALLTARAAFADLGLELQPSKTQAWSASSPCPQGLEPQWRPDGLTLGGVPLGEPLPPKGLPHDTDARRVDLGLGNFAAERCNEVTARAEALLDKLAALPTNASPHQPAVQVAALLLRLCGSGKVTHLLRSNPPASTATAAKAFDAALLRAYTELAQLDPLAPDQEAQCRLPLRLGGRGLRSQQDLAPAAWVASWTQSLAEVRKRSGLECLDDLESCTLPLAEACREALASLPAPDAPGDELPTWQELARTPTFKLQKVFTKRLDAKNHKALLDTLDDEGRARLRSCGGPHASAWQQASPAAPSERLEDADYATTARALLGQDLASTGATCRNRARAHDSAGTLCGTTLGSKARHAFRCSTGGGTKARSVALEREWERIHAECGYHTEREVHVPGWDRYHWRCSSCGCHGTAAAPPPSPCACGQPLDARREEAVLDLEVQSAACPRLFLDVTVRYSVPGHAARLTAASAHDGAVNREAEAEKRARYPDGCTPWKVLPLALETCGRHGPGALKHLRKLAREKASNQAEDSEAAAAGLVQRWAARLSVALHRATARQLRSALGADQTAASTAAELNAALGA